MAQINKTKAIFIVINHFLNRGELTAYDELLLDELSCTPRTLMRYFEDIETIFPNIIKIEKTKPTTWKLITINGLFKELLNSSNDIGYLFSMAQDFDPSIFSYIEKENLKKLLKTDEDVFLFKNFIMEELKEPKQKEIFNTLKSAIKNKNYIDIAYTYTISIEKSNLIPLKLVFMNNNWYIAILEKSSITFLRISFIDGLKVQKKSFKNKYLQNHLQSLKNLQNAMTLIDQKPKTATLKALPNIARYFNKGMKKYFPSQNFIKKESDGSTVFTINYTQPLEILPFIQRWLPDLIILEPKELKDEYVKKLENVLTRYKKA